MMWSDGNVKHSETGASLYLSSKGSAFILSQSLGTSFGLSDCFVQLSEIEGTKITHKVEIDMTICTLPVTQNIKKCTF